MFDWSQDFVNTRLELPNERHLRVPTIRWHEYKTWTLVQITQNYLHVMLQHVQEGNTGQNRQSSSTKIHNLVTQNSIISIMNCTYLQPIKTV